MSINADGAPDDVTPSCWACLEPMKSKKQRICLRCESWQRFPRSWISFSTTVLALLVALLGVGTTTLSLYDQRRDKSQFVVVVRPTSINKDGNNTVVLNLMLQNQGKHVSYVADIASCTGADGQVVQFNLPDRYRVLSAYMAEATSAFYTLDSSSERPRAQAYTCTIGVANSHGFEEAYMVTTNGTKRLAE